MNNTAQYQSASTLVRLVFQFLIAVTVVSCQKNMETSPPPVTPPPVTPIDSCYYSNFLGEYIFYSDTDTSSQRIEITSLNGNKFKTNGVSGYGFWFPQAPLSGKINDCKIVIDKYTDVKVEGLHTFGGTPRYYYESMSGHGEYYAKEDSIKLFLTFKRTGFVTANFSGEIFLVKVK